MADGPLDNLVQELHRIAGLTEAASQSDGRLLEVFTATSEPAALEALVRRHGPMVLGVCRRILRHTQDAEDAFQATFLVLVRKAAGLKRGEAVGNWLYGVAYRTALQTRTRSARRSRKEAEVPPMDAEESTVETAARLEMQALLDRELNRLPDKYRAPIILCDLLGKTKKQAAVELRCPEGTVSSRLARGRELLKKRLEHHAPTFAEAAVPLTVLGQTMTQAMPAGLCVNTVKAAVLIANGTTMASLSPSVAAIVQGVMKSMLITKLQTALMLFAGVALLSGMTYVVASGMGVGSGPGDVADKGKAEKPAPAVVVAEREAHAVAEVQPPPKIEEQTKKDELRYDGKNFNDWLKVLNTELMPERQIEAINALATFGTNGYGEAAAVAIYAVMKKAREGPKNIGLLKGTGTVLYKSQSALARIGPESLPVLAKELESDVVVDRRLAIETLSRYFGVAKLAERERLFLKGLGDKESTVRNAAIAGILSANEGKAWFSSSVTAAEKQALISKLATAIDEEKLSSTDLENALIVIGWFGTECKTAVPVLIKVLEQEKNTVPLARAAETIGKIGADAKDAVPALLQVLRDMSEKPTSKGQSASPFYVVEIYAVRALGQIGPEAKSAVPTLVEILTHTGNDLYPATHLFDGGQPPSRRVEAAKALAKLGKEGTSALIETASLSLKVTASKGAKGGFGKNEDPTSAAIQALAPLGPDAKEAVPVMVKLLEREGFWGIELSIIQALGRIGPDAKEAVPVLLKRLESMKAAKGFSFSYPQAVIVTLGEIGPGAKEAIPSLVEIRDAKEYAYLTPAELRQLKDAAAKALEKIQK